MSLGFFVYFKAGGSILYVTLKCALQNVINRFFMFSTEIKSLKHNLNNEMY